MKKELETLDIELLFLKSWMPLEEETYEGWILRSSQNFLIKGNCITALYDSPLSLEKKFNYCNVYYMKKNVRLAFKIIETKVGYDVDNFLRRKGLKKTKEISNQELLLEKVSFPTYRVNVSRFCEDNWIDFFIKEKKFSYDESTILKNILLRNEENSLFISKVINDEIVGIGLGIIVEGNLVILDIITNSSFKNCGSEILYSLISEAKKYKLVKAYMQVISLNANNLEFYKKIGFVEKYKSWYRYL